MSGATPTDDRTRGATGRLAALLTRWRRMEPRVGVIVIVVGLATGLWLGADGDAGSRVIARALAPSLQPPDADMDVLRRADEIASTGDGTAAERAEVATAYLKERADQLGRHPISAQVMALRQEALLRVTGQDVLRPFGARRRSFSLIQRPSSVVPFGPGGPEGESADFDDALVTAAPLGLLDRSHPTRRFAIVYAAELAGARGVGPICSALVRAGLSPAEAFVATNASSALDEPQPGCDASWFRTEWKGIADELCEIATDEARADGDRHAAIDALAWIADIPPPMLWTRAVSADARSKHAAQTWRRVRDLGLDQGLRLRLVTALEHVCDPLYNSEAPRADTYRWLRLRISVYQSIDAKYHEAVLELIQRRSEIEPHLLDRLDLPPDAAVGALLACVFDDPGDQHAQWLLAMRLARAGGVEPSPAPEGFRGHAEWRDALGLPPLRARVTIDRFYPTSHGVDVLTEVRDVPAESYESESMLGPSVAFRVWSAQGDLRAPGVGRGIGASRDQRVADMLAGLRWASYVSRDDLRTAAASVIGYASAGDDGDRRVTPLTTCFRSGRDGALRWERTTVESADSVEPPADWQERLCRALRQCRADWVGADWSLNDETERKRLMSVSAEAAALPAPAARDEIAALLDVRRRAWPDAALRDLVCALALAGEHDLLLRPDEHPLAQLTVWSAPADVSYAVTPAAWLALLCDTDDPALVELAVSRLSEGEPDPEVASVLLEVVHRRGFELDPNRRARFEASARLAEPRDVVELIVRRVELSYPLLGAFIFSLTTLLVALVARRQRRTTGGGARCAAWTVVLGLALVAADWNVGPLDVVPDWLGYLFAAHGCRELGKTASSRFGKLAAAAFVLAAVGDVVDQATLAEHGLAPFVDVVAMLGVLALAGLGRDVVRATTPTGDAPPRRPGRVRPVVVLAVVVGCTAVYLATSDLWGELTFDIELGELSRLIGVAIIAFVGVLALARRHAAPAADAALSPLPLPFVLGHAFPIVVLTGYGLTTDTGSPFPLLLDGSHLRDLTVVSTSLAVVWVLLRLLDAAGIATSRRGGPAGTAGGRGSPGAT